MAWHLDQLKKEKEEKDDEYARLTKAVQNESDDIDRILDDMHRVIQQNQRKGYKKRVKVSVEYRVREKKNYLQEINMNCLGIF